jgi:hydroxyethylthiazole kinase-like sugar kinase family protein
VTIWVADAHARVERLVSIVKLATVLECATEEQCSVVRFCGQKDAMQRRLKTFPVYDGKCLLRQVVTTGLINSRTFESRR